MRRSLLGACPLLAGLFLLGCGEDEAKKIRNIPLADAPPDLLKIARGKRPDLDIREVWKVKFRGEDAYEFKGKTKNGEIHEVELSPSGEVLEVE